MRKCRNRHLAIDTYITMTAYGRNAETALSDAEDKLIKLEQSGAHFEVETDTHTETSA